MPLVIYLECLPLPRSFTRKLLLTTMIGWSVTCGYAQALCDLDGVNVITNLVVTPDTTICKGSSKQLRTKPSIDFCWSPTTYLNDPLSPNPVTSATADVTYEFTAHVRGTNVITNGNFSSGNSGFTSGYNFAFPNTTESEYYVGANPAAWNGSLPDCDDHTSGSGNMMMINGSPVADVEVWTQTITVTPNIDYEFSTWIQTLFAQNPAVLRFSINGQEIGNHISASASSCSWNQFATTWNSGSNTHFNLNQEAFNKPYALKTGNHAVVAKKIYHQIKSTAATRKSATKASRSS